MRTKLLARVTVGLLALSLLGSGCERRLAAERTAQRAASLQMFAASGGRYRCGEPLVSDTAAAGAELRNSYAEWTRRYVTPQGAGGLLRVSMPEKRGETTSESTGYGMLLAAYFGDRSTFDRLWQYARRYRNARGLMSWEISADGRVLDQNSATDGDEDIAFALVVADSRWGDFRDDATAVIRALATHNVEPGTFVLKPGDVWGGSAVTGPSYFAPAYYRVFAEYTSDPRWLRVLETSYRILARVDARHDVRTGLAPEWATAAGDSVTVEAGFEFHYGYGAARVPWRLAMDAAWNCEPRAQTRLARLNAFFGRTGPSGIRDGYTLAGQAIGRDHNASFVAPLAAAAVVGGGAAYRTALWRETVALRNEGYYHDALRLLGLLFASGNMQPPSLRAAPPR